MSHEHFKSLSDEILNRLHAQRNYQFVMFTHILKNGPSTKKEICQALSAANWKNYGANKGWEYYKKSPVFEVLIGKKFVQEYQDGEREQEIEYDLHSRIDLTRSEKEDLIKVLNKAKREWEQK